MEVAVICNLRIFISHSWQYSGHYETLKEWIFDNNWVAGGLNLNFENNSVPKDDPIQNAANQQQLQHAIDALIIRSDVVVIPTGMYATHSCWIKKELQGAKKYRTPILGVNPWGQQRTSVVVQSKAKKTVGWTKESVLKGIVELGLK
ncbi:MAG: TIR domain-containing protein [Candidatus Puniceispirillales bacterium]